MVKCWSGIILFLFTRVTTTWTNIDCYIIQTSPRMIGANWMTWINYGRHGWRRCNAYHNNTIIFRWWLMLTSLIKAILKSFRWRIIIPYVTKYSQTIASNTYAPKQVSFIFTHFVILSLIYGVACSKTEGRINALMIV